MTQTEDPAQSRKRRDEANGRCQVNDLDNTWSTWRVAPPDDTILTWNNDLDWMSQWLIR
jgi:hypothetical protein